MDLFSFILSHPAPARKTALRKSLFSAPLPRKPRRFPRNRNPRKPVAPNAAPRRFSQEPSPRKPAAPNAAPRRFSQEPSPRKTRRAPNAALFPQAHFPRRPRSPHGALPLGRPPLSPRAGKTLYSRFFQLLILFPFWCIIKDRILQRTQGDATWNSFCTFSP